MPPPTSQDFMNELNNIFLDFNKIHSYQGAIVTIPSYVDVISGGLHRRLGHYPGPDHRMPICCNVMKQCMQSGDFIISQPPKGQGASLTIRYQLPRTLC